MKIHFAPKVYGLSTKDESLTFHSEGICRADRVPTAQVTYSNPHKQYGNAFWILLFVEYDLFICPKEIG